MSGVNGHERHGEGISAGRLRSEEFQILLGYQKPVEHVIAAPRQIEPLTGKRVARKSDSGERDLHDAADRQAQHRGECLEIGRTKADSSSVRARHAPVLRTGHVSRRWLRCARTPGKDGHAPEIATRVP